MYEETVLYGYMSDGDDHNLNFVNKAMLAILNNKNYFLIYETAR